MTEQKALTLAQAMSPATFEQALEFANRICNTDFVPKSDRGHPEVVLAKIQKGAEIGLPPMASLSNIAVINGHPSVWGDAMLALCRNHPAFAAIEEYFDEDGTAICIVTRRGEKPHKVTFSDADAKTAGLAGKEGPWRGNPKRMRQMRARSFCLRDTFPDALMGLISAEEAQDIDEPKVVGGGVAQPIAEEAGATPGGLTAALEGMDAEAGERPKETPVAAVQEAKGNQTAQSNPGAQGSQPANPKAETKNTPKAPKPAPEAPMTAEQQAAFNLALDELAAAYTSGEAGAINQNEGRKVWGKNRPKWQTELGEEMFKRLDRMRVTKGWEQ
jgi:hypothetical protein